MNKVVYAEAEIDLWDDEELIEEMKLRGYDCIKFGSESEGLTLNVEEAFLGMKCKSPRAMKKLEQFIKQLSEKLV